MSLKSIGKLHRKEANMSTSRKNGYESRFVSANSDNRTICPAIQRPKFCYETYEKAKKACEYSDNPQRIYYCNFCCAYHTTHFLKKSIEGTNRLLLRERGLRRAMYSNNKVLELERFSVITPAMSRAFKKSYHPVVKKYLIDYLYLTRDEVALSDAQLQPAFSKELKDKDERLFEETFKWPFCSLQAAMVFYILYYIQEKKFYYGESASDIVDRLFHKSDSSIGARKTIEEIFDSKQIIVSNEDSSGKRFKFDSFVLKSKKKPLPYRDIKNEDEGWDDDPVINKALNVNYHPVVKEYLVRHLRENRFNDHMLEGEELKICINDSILRHPDDEKAVSAIGETVKWRFSTERNAWKFLALYYLSVVGVFFALRPGDLVDQLFIQGERSNSFMGNVRGILYKKYSEGKIIITGMSGGGVLRYEFKDNIAE